MHEGGMRKESYFDIFNESGCKKFKMNQSMLRKYEPLPLQLDPELERPDLIPENILKFQDMLLRAMSTTKGEVVSLIHKLEAKDLHIYRLNQHIQCLQI